MGSDTLNDYKNAFNDFFYNININREQNFGPYQTFEGYIVYNDKFEQFYNYVNTLTDKEVEEKTRNGEIKLYTYFKHYLLDTIDIANVEREVLNGKIFIIINKDLAKLICKKNEQEKINYKVKYNVNANRLEFNLENGQKIQFRNNKNNIIDKSALFQSVINNVNSNINSNINSNASSNINSNVNSNTNPNANSNVNSNLNFNEATNNWNKIFYDCKNYFEIEKEIENKLKLPNINEYYQGIFVDEAWFNNWKKYSYYDKIKPKFLEPHLSNQEIEIKNLIIKEQMESKLNYNEININESNIVSNENQIKESNNYILLNEKFLQSFNKNKINLKSNNNIHLSPGKILLIFPNSVYFPFLTNNNIVSKVKLNNNNNSQNSQKSPDLNNNKGIGIKTYDLLYYLIKFPLFKTELTKFINQNTNNPFKVYLIKREIKEKMKQLVFLNELFDILEKHNLLNGINYHNFDLGYPNIYNYLKVNQIQYMNNISRYEAPGSIQFDSNEAVFIDKYLNNNLNLNYIDGFEIIDQKFAEFLSLSFPSNIQIIVAVCELFENKIFLAINFKNKFIYEIVYMNPDNGNLITEYLIETSNNTTYNDTIFQNFKAYGLSHIINTPGELVLNNNTRIKFHKINNNPSLSSSSSLNTSINNKEINLNNLGTSVNNMNQTIGASAKIINNNNISPQFNAQNNVNNQMSNVPVQTPYLNNLNSSISVNNHNYSQQPPINQIPNYNNQVNEINSKTLIVQNSRNKQIGVNINKIEISDRLKAMILFIISQFYPFGNKEERVYLINKKWLEDYDYKGIRTLVINKFNEIREVKDFSFDINSVNKIIHIFDINELTKYDQKMKHDNQIPHLAPAEQIQIKNKYIHIYTEFILMREKIYNLFMTYFKFTPTHEKIYYICKKNKEDLIIIKDQQLYGTPIPNNFENLVLGGIIDKNKNIFNIQHIFDYNTKEILDKEMNIFSTSEISNYISTKTDISFQKNNAYISPIFDNNKIIGNYYKYYKNCDYKNCINYSEFILNKQLRVVHDLYLNELSINSKLQNKSMMEGEFCLIKKQVLSDIQTQNNYDKLKKFFENKLNKDTNNEKDLYKIIKSLPQNELIELANNLQQKPIQKADISFYDLDLLPIKNPSNEAEVYWISNNFELIENHFAYTYLKGNYPYHTMKCTILGNNMIVFHYYPNNKFNNTKYMFLVSKIVERNNFINEYLIIYVQRDYIGHFEQIKKNLNNFLSQQYYLNNTAPIVYGEGIQIGTIINLTGKQQQQQQPQQPISSSNTTTTPSSPITLTPGKEDEYFPPIPFCVTDSIQDFPSKPLIGLDNIGATCYMNATLQCLCNIKKFVDYFKYNKHLIEIVKNDTKKEKLCSAFKMVIESLYNYKISNNYKMDLQKKGISIPKIKLKSSYPPRNFKDTISRMNPLFQGVAANDAKDLVNFLLMTLHAELNRALPETNNNMGNLLLDQRNQEFMFQIFADNFRKTNRSIISDLFYAMNCNKTQCGNCNSISYNYQIYFFLIFPLEEVRKFRLMYGGYNNNYPNNMVDIYDCFNYDQKISFMSGDNAMYCNYCKQTCPSNMCTLLTTGPEILIIILNRGQGIQFDVKINFYLELNLMNYIQLKETGCNYELFGVITHIGSSDMGGHFIAYCKSYFQNDYNKWYRFNDSLVTPVNDFQKEVIQFAMPYLLFYKKK